MTYEQSLDRLVSLRPFIDGIEAPGFVALVDEAIRECLQFVSHDQLATDYGDAIARFARDERSSIEVHYAVQDRIAKL